MIRLLKFLWYGCFHEWEDNRETHFQSGRASGWAVYCRCRKCGEHKLFTHARMRDDSIRKEIDQ